MEPRKLAASAPVRYDRETTDDLEDALGLEVLRRKREAWLEENREGIEAYNELVAQQGVFSTGLRGF